MKKMRFLMPVWFLLMAAGFSAIVMLLWNWLMPALFGLIAINFWQALGLLVLARILFGGFGMHRMMHRGRMHGMHHNNPVHEKWMKMSPEERKEFIKKRHSNMCGGPFGRRDFWGEQEAGMNDNPMKDNE